MHVANRQLGTLARKARDEYSSYRSSRGTGSGRCSGSHRAFIAGADAAVLAGRG